MGPDLVVGRLEPVEDALLEITVRGGRPRHLLFERPVESLMRAVLLRTAGSNALMGDPELQPPDVEAAETMDAGGGERRAAVGADGVRESAGTKQPAEMRHHSLSADIVETLAAEEVAAQVVDDGQGVAVDAVAHTELAFVVDRPDLVGTGGAQWSGARILPWESAPSVLDMTVAGEDVEDVAARGPGAMRLASAKAL